jgi:amphi-Trp domain-containing protein
MSKTRAKGKKIKVQRVRLRGDASEEAALRIEELARGLRSGIIHFADGEVAMDAPAGSELAWEIEARQGRRKSRIEIEIRWRAPESRNEGDDEGEDEDEEDTEPEVVAEVEAESDATPAETPSPEASAPDEDKPELENPAW